VGALERPSIVDGEPPPTVVSHHGPPPAAACSMPEGSMARRTMTTLRGRGLLRVCGARDHKIVAVLTRASPRNTLQGSPWAGWPGSVPRVAPTRTHVVGERPSARADGGYVACDARTEPFTRPPEPRDGEAYQRSREWSPIRFTDLVDDEVSRRASAVPGRRPGLRSGAAAQAASCFRRSTTPCGSGE
jgi:hypothetical protein